jgi:hypothetical protein
MKKIAFLALGSVLFFSSCKKDDATPTTCTLSSTSIQGTYKVTGSTFQANANAPVEDDYATWDACEKDDLFVFGNGTLTSSEGATSCTPPADPFSANWTLSGTTLNLDVAGFTVSGTVESFTCNSMVFKVSDPADNSISRTTFTRQ